MLLLACSEIMTNEETFVEVEGGVSADVTELPDNCLYDDGYQCYPNSPKGITNYLSLIDETGMFPAGVLKAWDAVRTDFLQNEEIQAEKRDLKHYKVGFAYTEGVVEVVLRPLMLPQIVDGKPQFLIGRYFGQGVTYQVDLSSGVILSRLYHK